MRKEYVYGEFVYADYKNDLSKEYKTLESKDDKNLLELWGPENYVGTIQIMKDANSIEHSNLCYKLKMRGDANYYGHADDIFNVSRLNTGLKEDTFDSLNEAIEHADRIAKYTYYVDVLNYYKGSVEKPKECVQCGSQKIEYSFVDHMFTVKNAIANF